MSDNAAPVVSVVTPVYNGADFIAECIESVLTQTRGDFEYLIVNNCSKDNTLDIARSYARKDSRITVHDNTTFLGVIANHNLAFSLMNKGSKYCKVVSADDWIFPECLERMVDFAEAHPSVGVVGCYSIAGKEILFDGLEYERSIVNGREICRETLLGGLYVFGAPSSLLYRTDLMRKTDAFYPNPSPHADVSAVYASLTDTDFGFIHQILSYTRIHAETQTSNSFKFGRINRALLANVIDFGPRYLSDAELKTQLGVMTDKYYNWLVAAALFEHSFSKQFLDEQRAGLQEIGLRLSKAKIAKACLVRGAELLRSPNVTATKILAMLRRRGKVEARTSRAT